MCAQVYVSIGSNIERERNIGYSLQALREAYGALQLSSVYESRSVGFDSAPFYNLVAGFRTNASPQAVQAKLHAIESAAGRVRTAHMTARTLDLDLLLYDDRVVREANLTLPRDDITRYAFVLCPLAELAGNARHPVTGERYADLWAAFDRDSQPLAAVDWPPRPA